MFECGSQFSRAFVILRGIQVSIELVDDGLDVCDASVYEIIHT